VGAKGSKQPSRSIHAHGGCKTTNSLIGNIYWNLDLKPGYWMFDLDNGRENQDVSLEQNVCWNSDDDNNRRFR
jgi:hypothetical protein